MPFRSMQRLEKQTLVLNIKVNMNKITGLPYDKKAWERLPIVTITIQYAVISWIKIIHTLLIHCRLNTLFFNLDFLDCVHYSHDLASAYNTSATSFKQWISFVNKISKPHLKNNQFLNIKQCITIILRVLQSPSIAAHCGQQPY